MCIRPRLPERLVRGAQEDPWVIAQIAPNCRRPATLQDTETAEHMTRLRPSIRLVRINRIDRAGPRAVVFFQQLLRRRGAARHAILQHFEVTCLVAAAGIEVPAACEACAR